MEDIAKLSGRCVQTIRNHRKAGLLKARYPLAKRKFHADDVENYLCGLK
ncbi:helix-turn-helix domain-containing protein [Candidatus Uabimicrobium sp. HlEnr_7]